MNADIANDNDDGFAKNISLSEGKCTWQNYMQNLIQEYEDHLFIKLQVRF